MHIGCADLLRQRLHQCLLLNPLDPDVDLLIRGRVAEVLDATLRQLLLQPLTVVSRPGARRELGDHKLVLLLLEDTNDTVLSVRALEPFKVRHELRIAL